MKKVLMLIADGVEDSEALTTRDILVRAGITVVTKSIMGRYEVMSSHGVMFNCDVYKYLPLSDFDGIVLPGGGRGTQNLDAYKEMDEYLEHFAKEHKLLAAICAAPMVLGHRGYLKGKKFTCFKGCEEGLDGIYTGKEVERDDNIITGRSMYFSADFGLEIVKYLLDDEVALKVEKAIKSL